MVPGASTDPEKDKEKGKDKQTTEPEKVKKRTGKPRAAADRLKFAEYFERWLAEKGITFRSWLQEHRRKHLWLWLGGIDGFVLYMFLIFEILWYLNDLRCT